MEVGGRPILWHVLEIYRAQGFSEFLLLTGFRGEAIERSVESQSWAQDTSVRCLSTGVNTPTGGRLRQAAELLGPGTVCVSYADGVADVDLIELLAFHRRHDGPATMTLVRPQLPFGVAELNGDGVVTGFTEKPRSEHWINAGFFCFEREFLRRLEPDSTLEREPLAELARLGQLRGFHHKGFWQCMDTYKDAIALNELWDDGRAPWKLCS